MVVSSRRGHLSQACEEPSSMYVIDPCQFPSVFRRFGKLTVNFSWDNY